MKNVSKQTIERIKESHISPRPRHYFLLKRSTVWGIFGISIVLGALAAAVCIFQLNNAEWELYRHLKHSPVEFALLVVPYFWLLFFLGFSAIAYYYFRRTSGGHHYRTASVLLLSFTLSVIGGAVIHSVGFSEKLEMKFQESIPFFANVEAHKRKVWMTPKRGLLSGKISEVVNDEQILLKDLNGNSWHVDVSGAIWRGRLVPSVDLEIKLIGKMQGENAFTAEEIRPWQGRGKNKGKRH